MVGPLSTTTGARPTVVPDCAEAAIGVLSLAAAVSVARSWPRWDRVRRRVGVFLLVVILIAAGQSVLNSTTFDLQPQARYLLVAAAAAAPIAAWTLAGRRVAPAWAVRGLAIAALVGVALLLDASGLITAAHTSA